jgi:hypothetical protein
VSDKGLHVMAAIAVAAACGATPLPPAPPPAPHAATAFTDFSFARGAPLAGVRLTACGRVNLSTTHTVARGGGAFRNEVASTGEGRNATVTFTFDRPLSTFDVRVSDVDPDDFLADFNVGSPPRLSGGLIQTADGRVTAGPGGKAAAGVLSWSEMGTTSEVRFVVRAAAGSVVVEAFRVTCRP